MPSQAAKKTRTRSGCLNCRRRRRKCDETRPTCLNCSKRNEKCQRGVRLNFRDENAQTIDDHGKLESDHPLEQVRPGKRTKHFNIVDVTTDIVDQYSRQSPSQDLISVFPVNAEFQKKHTIANIESPSTSGVAIFDSTSSLNGVLERSSISSPTNHSISVSPPEIRTQIQSLQQTDAHDRPTTTSSVEARQVFDKPSAGLRLPDTVRQLPAIHNTTEDAAQNLLYLRQMQRSSIIEHDSMATPYSPGNLNISPPFSNTLDPLGPDSLFDDGVFIPGSTYQELHAMLRRHLIDETNSGVPTRLQTPQTETEPKTLRQVGFDSRVREQIEADDQPYDDHTPPLELSQEEEYRLWKNWFDEIAGWLDKFDNQRHFQHTLPTMAQSCDHLRFSMLAVSARQLELKRRSKPTDQSLGLYQQAIHLLLPQLHTRQTTVIASCVVLCVLEMLSCSPKAWRRHLDGCANLMQAVGITGFSGGVEQALFWCFARMDVCGGLIDAMTTLIPVDQWCSKIDMDADIGLFRALTATSTMTMMTAASSSFHTYANHMVYLCAQVLNLLSKSRSSSTHENLDSRCFADRWLKIWRFVQDWGAKRPAEMLPVTTVTTTTTSAPFPTILYSNAAAISGNQLFHTANILLLQNRPTATQPQAESVSSPPRPVRWHACQICGISLSHDHHGAWTNSVQPLWIAGRCMRRPDEQRAVIDHLRKIERESGWETAWRVTDLLDYWDNEYGSDTV